MRDTSAPNTLKACTLCFCPCNAHPLANGRRGLLRPSLRCFPKRKLLPWRSSGSPWGQHVREFPLQYPPQANWYLSGVGHEWCAVSVFSLATHSLGPSSAFWNFTTVLCDMQMKHISLPSHLHSSIVLDSKGRIMLIIQIVN